MYKCCYFLSYLLTYINLFSGSKESEVPQSMLACGDLPNTGSAPLTLFAYEMKPLLVMRVLMLSLLLCL